MRSIYALAFACMASAAGAQTLLGSDSAQIAAPSFDLSLDANETRVIRLAAPIDGVAIGNPDVAVVTAHNRTTLLVTGKRQGTTNLVALSSTGAIVYSAQVQVRGQAGTSRVDLYRGVERVENICAPKCVETPRQQGNGDAVSALAATGAILGGGGTPAQGGGS